MKEEAQILRVQMTSLAVLDRPETFNSLMESRKDSTSSSLMSRPTAESPRSSDASDQGSNIGTEDDNAEDEDKNKHSKSSSVTAKDSYAMPIDFLAGTLLGGIFKANLSKVKVEVESGDLQCPIEWSVNVHDGPTKFYFTISFR